MGWLDDWTYRQKFQIINDSIDPESDYQLVLKILREVGSSTLNTAYVEDKCELDYDDIRITTSDGTTSLDYWIEESSTISALLWIEYNTLPLGSTIDFYLYYGNNVAASYSDGDDTFQFFDHFEGTSLDPSKWTEDYTVGSGVVTVSNSTVSVGHGTSTGHAKIHGSLPIAMGLESREFHFRAKFNSLYISSYRQIGCTQNKVQYWDGNRMHQQAGSNQQYRVFNVKGGQQQLTNIASDGMLEPTHWSMRRHGYTSLKYYRENTLLVNHQTAQYLPIVDFNYIEIWGNLDATGQARDIDVDWVFICKGKSTPPTYGTWSPEDHIGEPYVVTLDATGVEANEATLNAEITDSGHEDVTEIGFEWGTIPTAYENTWTTANGTFPLGTFDHLATSLDSDTIYYFRGKAYNVYGWGYGLEEMFTTKEAIVPPTVVTEDATEVSAISAILQAIITDVGRGTVDIIGFEWDTDSGIPYENTWTQEGTYEISLIPYTQWHLNESSGNVASDSSGYGRNGTLNNMENEDWVTGKLNNCLLFDGVNEYVDCGNIANWERSQAFSVEAWINTSFSGAGQGIICKFKSPAPAVKGWEFAIHSDGRLRFGLFSSSSSRFLVFSVPTVNDGDWYHVVATYDGSSDGNNVNLYIDGSLVSKTVLYNNLTASIIHTDPCKIGARREGFYFDGKIDEAIIYEREITSEEVTYRWNSGDGTEEMKFGGFYHLIESLLSYTDYYFRGIAHNTAGWGYGEENTLTTLGIIPNVITLPANSITFESANLRGTIDATGGKTLSIVGFDWGTSTGEYTKSWTQEGTYGLESFEHGISTLDPNETYYFRAKGFNPEGWGYGSEGTFSTSVGPCTVLTRWATEVDIDSCILQGKITYLGGENLDEIGFKWGTISASYENTWTTSGTYGLEEFDHYIGTLTTESTIFYKAMGHNSYGWEEGTEYSVLIGVGLEYWSKPKQKIVVNGTLEIQSDALSVSVTRRENKISDCLILANDYKGKTFLEQINANDEIWVYYKYEDGDDTWKQVFGGWVVELNPQLSMGGEMVGIKCYGYGIALKKMRVKGVFGTQSELGSKVGEYQNIQLCNGWTFVHNDFTYLGTVSPWLDSEDGDDNCIDIHSYYDSIGDYAEYWGFSDIYDYPEFTITKCKLHLKGRLYAGGDGSPTRMRMLVYLWDGSEWQWVGIWSWTTGSYVDVSGSVKTWLNTRDKINSARLKIEFDSAVDGGVNKGGLRITYAYLEVEGTYEITGVDRLRGILTSDGDPKGIIESYVEKVLGTTIPSEYSFNTNYIAENTIQFRYLNWPYEPVTSAIQELCDLTSAALYINDDQFEAGLHWMVLPDGALDPKICIAQIGNHDETSPYNVEDVWPSYAFNRQIITVTTDMVSSRFAKMEVDANYILYQGIFELPTDERWTEGNAFEWGIGQVEGFPATGRMVDNDWDKKVGDFCIRALVWTQGNFVFETWYPKVTGMNLDITKLGTKRSVPTISFYIKKEGTDYVSLQLYTDATMGEELPGGQVWYLDIDSLMPEDGKWHHIVIPIGPHYNLKEVSGGKVWGKIGNPTWTDLDYIVFKFNTKIAHDPMYVQIDNLKINGVQVRGAYHSGNIGTNKCKIKLITDSLAKSDNLDKDNVTDSISRLAKAELIRSMNVPITGTIQIPMRADVLPGQLIRIRASRTATGFHINKDMRILEVKHSFSVGGAFTYLTLTDDLKNSYPREVTNDYNALMKAVNPDYQDRDRASAKGSGIDIDQEVLDYDYA